jgi:hypothetical protein
MKLLAVFCLLTSALCLTAAEQIVTEGSRVTLTVTHDGGVLKPGSAVPDQTTGFSYQWFKDGRAIEGATAKSYVIASATAADVANYTCRVTNAAGQVVSAPAGLWLLLKPTEAKPASKAESPPTGASP